MTQNITHKKRYITFLVALVVLMLSAIRSQAQCNWDVTAVPIASTCAANGKITASLTGADAGSLSNILYSLEPLTAGGYEVQQNPSPVFENVPPGSYRVVVEAVCSGAEVNDSYTVTVPGNYVPLTATATQERATLNNCNTGQITVTLANGKIPDTILITSKPAAYSGPVSFVTSSSSLLIDHLNAGTYTLSVKDACGTTAATQTVTIDEMPVFAESQFGIGAYGNLNGSCDRFIVYAPNMASNGSYNTAGTPITFSVAFDGGTKLPYKSISATSDTILLPAGQTLKDAYGKTITFYIKSSCGEELVVNRTLYPPAQGLTITTNCTTNFDANFSLYNTPLGCYPVYISVKNNSTNAYRYDTIQSASDNFLKTIKGLSYGNYTFASTTADGYVIYQDPDWTVSAPDLSNPYTIYIFDMDGIYGNVGAAGFYIIKSTGNFSEGTTIQLISPSNYTYSATVGASATNYFYMLNPSSPQNSYFNKGNYVFRVTDACGTYDLPVTVAEKDVYSYNWTFTTKQTCTGLEVTPSGTAMYNEASQPVYYQILSGPSGYDNTVVPQGTPLVLPFSGAYKIGISANSGYVGDYGVKNTQTISFTYNPLAIDVNRSLGWICPGQPANSGSITAIAINGSTAATGVYTYKLAAAGQGSTGPYLATNTTGKFSTASSGGAYTLMKDQNYDIKVEDECGAAAVQTIKIIDFATAQVASSDKPQYCLGDAIRFKVINLPTTAVVYKWTGPDGVDFSTEQNPVVQPVKTTSGGTYHVKISADICEQAIEDDVIITLAPYVVSCYSAVTDTSVNPYAYGLLGNWRPARSYTWYGARGQSDPEQQTNIRQDGAFNDFMAFWKKETSGWTPQTSNPNWVWNAATTIFNKKGFELENKDPLGRYNAGLYGYDNAIPVAVIQNSRYREAAFEGFEDYGFGGNNCDEACAIGRRFYFWSTESKLDTTEKHTGKYSLRVLSSDTIGLKVVVASTANDPADPVFTEGDNICPPAATPVLKSVRADASVLLPSFSPLSGKKILFSAWVKEAQDCKCTAYSGNQVALVVTGTTNIGVIAKPVGSIIEGWQRYEQVVDLPVGTDTFSVILQATGTTAVYFDDIRIHPYNANMKSFVYDPQSLRLMAELDENNYATFYEYDDDGTLTRVKKETERGIKTIKETRSALIKETGEQELNTGN